MFRGTLKPAKVLRLLGKLPIGSSFIAAQNGSDEWRGWDQTTLMVMHLWNLIAQVNTPKKAKAPTFPMPGKKSSDGMVSLGQVRRASKHGRKQPPSAPQVRVHVPPPPGTTE